MRASVDMVCVCAESVCDKSDEYCNAVGDEEGRGVVGVDIYVCRGEDGGIE